jgi:hypothetical protein
MTLLTGIVPGEVLASVIRKQDSSQDIPVSTSSVKASDKADYDRIPNSEYNLNQQITPTDTALDIPKLTVVSSEKINISLLSSNDFPSENMGIDLLSDENLLTPHMVTVLINGSEHVFVTGVNEACTAAIAIYDLNGKMLGLDIQAIGLNQATAMSSITLDPIPEDYNLKLFLLDDSLEPLCDSYLFCKRDQYMVEFSVLGSDSLLKDANIYIDGQTVTTDKSGSAQLNLKNGSYEYTIHHDGYEDENGIVTVDNENASEVLFLLQKNNTVNFRVVCNDEPVEEAQITINGIVIFTDDNGEASIDLMPGEYPYEIKKTCFTSVVGTVSVTDDSASIQAVLENVPVQISFEVTAGGEAAVGATITIGENEIVTDNNGYCEIMLNIGEYAYTLKNAGYQDYSGTITVTSDKKTVNVNLSALIKDITFHVTDSLGVGISGAKIVSGTEVALTNYLGQASFTTDSSKYSVTANGYTSKTGDILDETVSIILEKPIYSVNVIVTDGTIPISDARVSLGDREWDTDVYGKAQFSLSSGTYSYSVAKDCYTSETGELQATGSITVGNMDASYTITMKEIVFNQTFYVTSEEQPVAQARVTIGGRTAWTDEEGMAVISIPATQWPESISCSIEKEKYVTWRFPGGISKQSNLFHAELNPKPLVAIYFDIGEGWGYPNIMGATITIDGTTAYIGENGESAVVYLREDSTYTYTVSKSGYTTIEDTITSDSRFPSQYVCIYPQATAVSFVISDGNKPIEGATINISGYDSLLTDELGQAVSSAFLGTKEYTITKDGYVRLSGSITMPSDSTEICVTMEKLHNVTLYVTDNLGPVSYASVYIEETADQNQYTDANGILTVQLPNGTYNVVISKNKYWSYTGSFVVSGDDFLKEIQLKRKMFKVTFNVTNGESGITDAVINTENTSIATDENGSASIYLEEGNHNYTIYTGQGTVYQTYYGNVYITDVDAVLTCQLIRKTCSFEFVVVDKGLLPGAVISIEGQGSVTTNNIGRAYMILSYGEYSYTVSKDCYSTVTGTISVSDSCCRQTISLVPNIFNVVVKVTDGNLPMEGASITLTRNLVYGVTKYYGNSDAEGHIFFSLPNATYEYTIVSPYYVSKSGSFTVSGVSMTVTEELEAEKGSLQFLIKEELSDRIGDVIGGASIVIGNFEIITGTDGTASMELPFGTYAYTISAVDYVSYAGTVSVYNTQVSQFGAIKKVEQNAKYTVTINVSDIFGLQHNAFIMMDGVEVETENNTAVFTLANDRYYYSIRKYGNQGVFDSITVTGADVEKTVVLNALQFNVKIYVDDGLNPLVSATVVMNGVSVTTNTAGYAAFSLTNGTYSYKVLSSGYCDAERSLTVDGSNVNTWISLTKQKYGVTFTVADEAGLVAGASVSTGNMTALTDEAGQAFMDLEFGTYPYTVSKNDYSTVTKELTVGYEAAEETVSLSHIPHKVTFNINNGTQISAWVAVSGYTYPFGQNWDGKAYFNAISGDYDYSVTASEYVATTGKLSVTGAAITESVILNQVLYSYTVTLKDESSLPISEAVITVGNHVKVTDVSGIAVFALPKGTYDFTARYQDYKTVSGSLSVNGTGSKQLVMTPSHQLMITVLDSFNDSVLEGAMVEIAEETFITDADGKISRGMLSGTYTYNITMNDYVTRTGLVNVSSVSPDTIEVVIKLERKKYALTLSMTDELGNTIPRAEVNTGSSITRADDEGKLTLILKSGSYSFSISATGYEDLIYEIVIASETTDTMKTAVMSQIEGYEIITPGGEKVVITVMDDETAVAGGEISMAGRTVTTDLNGQAVFVLSASEMPYEFTITKAEYLNKTITVVVAQGVTEQTVMLEPVLYLINISVLSDTSEPIASASVSIDNITKSTDALGAAEFHLTSGYYDYSVTVDGYITEQNTISVTEHEGVQITLNPVKYLVGIHVCGEDTNPMQGVSVQAGEHQSVTDETGWANFYLKNGAYLFTVSKLGYELSTVNVQVYLGATTGSATMTPQQYELTLCVFSGENPVEGASVVIGGKDFITNSSGKVISQCLSDSYDYSIVKSGYYDAAGNVSVTYADVTKNIVLVEKAYKATITVNFGDETVPVDTEIYQNGIKLTSAFTYNSGKAAFTLVNGTYTYKIIDRNGYFETIEDSFTISDNDVTVNCELKYYFTFVVNNSSSYPGYISGATISINGQQKNTDSAGKVTFALPGGTYDYTVTHLDFYTIADTLTVYRGVKSISMRYNKFETNFMFYKDYTSPLANATIQIGGLSAVTDESGKATVMLTEGTHEYTVTAVGCAESYGSITLTNQGLDHSVVVMLERKDCNVTMTFTDGEKFIADTQVIIESATTQYYNGKIINSKYSSASSGMVNLTAKSDTYTISCKAPGYSLLTKSISFTDDYNETIILEQKPVVLTVTVSSDYSVIGDTSVTIGGVTVLTGDDGLAVFNLMPGTYAIEVSHADYVTYEDVITIECSETKSYDLTLTGKAYSVGFMVTEEDGALSGATVSVSGQTAVTDEYGRAVIDLKKGEYTYAVNCEHYNDKSGSFTVVIQDEPQNIELAMEKALYPQSFTVMVDDAPVEAAIISSKGKMLTTDSHGKASLLLPYGNQEYTVSSFGYYSVSGTISVDTDNEGITVHLIIEPYETSFVVLDGTVPLENVAVTTGGSTVYTDSNGKATFYLTHGVYEYTLDKFGYFELTESITVAGGIPEVAVTIIKMTASELAQSMLESEQTAEYAENALGQIFNLTQDERANNLVEGGYSLSEVAAVLKNVHSKSTDAIATFMNLYDVTSSEALTAMSNASIAEIGDILVAMKSAGYSTMEIMTAVININGGDINSSGDYLKSAGFSALDISNSLFTLGIPDNEVAEVLLDLSFSFDTVMSAVKATYNNSAAHMASVIAKLGYVCSEACILIKQAENDAAVAAEVLISEGYVLKDIYVEVKDCWNLDDNESVKILVDLGYDLEDMVSLLTEIYGCVGLQIYDGEITDPTAASYLKIVTALRYAGFEAMEICTLLDFIDVDSISLNRATKTFELYAVILKAAGFSAVEVGEVTRDYLGIYDAYAEYAVQVLYDAGYSLDDICTVLHDVYTQGNTNLWAYYLRNCNRDGTWPLYIRSENPSDNIMFRYAQEVEAGSPNITQSMLNAGFTVEETFQSVSTGGGRLNGGPYAIKEFLVIGYSRTQMVQLYKESIRGFNNRVLEIDYLSEYLYNAGFSVRDALTAMTDTFGFDDLNEIDMRLIDLYGERSLFTAYLEDSTTNREELYERWGYLFTIYSIGQTPAKLHLIIDDMKNVLLMSVDRICSAFLSGNVDQRLLMSSMLQVYGTGAVEELAAGFISGGASPADILSYMNHNKATFGGLILFNPQTDPWKTMANLRTAGISASDMGLYMLHKYSNFSIIGGYQARPIRKDIIKRFAESGYGVNETLYTMKSVFNIASGAAGFFLTSYYLPYIIIPGSEVNTAFQACYGQDAIDDSTREFMEQNQTALETVTRLWRLGVGLNETAVTMKKAGYLEYDILFAIAEFYKIEDTTWEELEGAFNSDLKTTMLGWYASFLPLPDAVRALLKSTTISGIEQLHTLLIEASYTKNKIINAILLGSNMLNTNLKMKDYLEFVLLETGMTAIDTIIDYYHPNPYPITNYYELPTIMEHITEFDYSLRLYTLRTYYLPDSPWDVFHVMDKIITDDLGDADLARVELETLWLDEYGEKPISTVIGDTVNKSTWPMMVYSYRGWAPSKEYFAVMFCTEDYSMSDPMEIADDMLACGYTQAQIISGLLGYDNYEESRGTAYLNLPTSDERHSLFIARLLVEKYGKTAADAVEILSVIRASDFMLGLDLIGPNPYYKNPQFAIDAMKEVFPDAGLTTINLLYALKDAGYTANELYSYIMIPDGYAFDRVLLDNMKALGVSASQALWYLQNASDTQSAVGGVSEILKLMAAEDYELALFIDHISNDYDRVSMVELLCDTGCYSLRQIVDAMWNRYRNECYYRTFNSTDAIIYYEELANDIYLCISSREGYNNDRDVQTVTDIMSAFLSSGKLTYENVFRVIHSLTSEFGSVKKVYYSNFGEIAYLAGMPYGQIIYTITQRNWYGINARDQFYIVYSVLMLVAPKIKTSVWQDLAAHGFSKDDFILATTVHYLRYAGYSKSFIASRLKNDIHADWKRAARIMVVGGFSTGEAAGAVFAEYPWNFLVFGMLNVIKRYVGGYLTLPTRLVFGALDQYFGVSFYFSEEITDYID